jgi:myo-inositol-1(or 4)-monophosphatase
MEEYLEFAKEIANKAGKIMLKYFNMENVSSYKFDKTIVTLADQEINSYLIKRVKETFPTHSVDGEEEQFGNSNYVWVCDPVDGTAMYARHIPVAVFSLALVVDGVSQIGVVYDVFTNNLYTAIKGKGAFKNDKKISVNDIALNDMRSIVHFDMWPASKYNIYDVIKELGKETYIVSIGSVIRACMCVASGEFTAVIFPGTLHKNCDIAAAKVIVEEAGGKVTDFFGNEQRYDKNINGAIIANSIVYEKILSTINTFLKDKNCN